MKLRSQQILSRPEWSINRAYYKSMGYSDTDLDKPIIGIANAWSTTVPGHYNLRQVSESVKEGIREAGGTPVEFGVIGACDGIAEGHEGMRYILPTRDIIAHSIELMVQAHQYDAIVLLGSCDKIVPGMLMAAARLDLPSIFVNGGPMLSGPVIHGRKADTTSIIEGVGKLKKGEITEEKLIQMEDSCAPTCGSCSFLGTANTMCCVAEAMGMSLTGSAMIPAVYNDRLKAAQDSGRAIVNLVKEGITARQIITRASIENAVRLSSAIGGSTNAALHIPAIAYEAKVDFDMEDFDKLSRSTPLIAKMNPAASPNVIDFYESGGVPVVMKEIASLLHKGAMTVTSKTIEENIKDFNSPNNEIIKTFKEPFTATGGLAVLYGNLAPNSAVTKPAAINPKMWTFSGPAKVFNSEEEANKAILDGEVKEGDVVVIRYEGPKGGPGMPEMFKAMKLLYGLGLADKVALVTDGRFSGTNNGCFVGHISPEAQEGGPIAFVQDGDMIEIDIPERKLELLVGEEELKKRRAAWQAPKPRVEEGYLYLYSRLAESADKGAIIKNRA
ncbi:dihydroxy-acid dehydratase [Clostridium formicaceticum]|uniref:Dihydroxy-acid dehydratase n=1 Tax=Clostridium formicaceticum TaxID=1497 RepID=A0AAC9WFV9_9CLOT|nr:dihydroxy-acid dehydratase [Clostridium formicaceticum]AOY75865.1 dihydroxy-acid dehydratase [Clostridium formicaceticum]ARE86205.1 Dihydroxy-acid dehydratase [Clostridium formicaceticum]